MSFGALLRAALGAGEPESRGEATRLLEQATREPGAAPQLLALAGANASASADAAEVLRGSRSAGEASSAWFVTRLGAAILLKRVINGNWHPLGVSVEQIQYMPQKLREDAFNHFCLSDADKEEVRNGLLGAIVMRNNQQQLGQRGQAEEDPLAISAVAEERIRRQLVECFARVFENDFEAGEWPALVPQVATVLGETAQLLHQHNELTQQQQQSQEYNVAVFANSRGALEALRVMTRRFEHVMPSNKKRRRILLYIAEACFQPALSILQALSAVQAPSSVEEAVELSRLKMLIAKCFSSATHVGVPPCLVGISLGDAGYDESGNEIANASASVGGSRSGSRGKRRGRGRAPKAASAVAPDGTVLSAWLSALTSFLSDPIPDFVAAAAPSDPADRRRWPIFKAKEWTSRIVEQLAQRYGDPSVVDTGLGGIELAAAQVVASHAPVLLQAVFQELSVGCVPYASVVPPEALSADAHGDDWWYPERILFHCTTIIQCCIQPRQLYLVIQGNMDAVLQTVCFSLLRFRQRNWEMWIEDFEEYLRLRFDVEEEFYAADTAALNVISDAARLRGKHHLPMFMEFLLRQYQHACEQQSATGDTQLAPGQAVPAWAADKYAVLRALQALRMKLMRGEPWASQVEDLIVKSIFIPELSSPMPFLRGAAAACIAEYCDVWLDEEKRSARLRGAGIPGLAAPGEDSEDDDADDDADQENTTDGPVVFPPSSQSAFAAVEGLYTLMQTTGEDLVIVRVQAGVALALLLRLGVGRDVIQPVLGQCLTIFLQLMREVESDELINIVDTLVRVYKSEITPYGVSLVQELCVAFEQIASDALVADDGGESLLLDEELDRGSGSGIAVYEILNTIQNIINACAKNTRSVNSVTRQQMFADLAQPLIRILNLLYGHDQLIEFLDAALKIHSFLTWFLEPPFDPAMWSLLASLRGLFDSIGTDLMEAILIPIDHYISKDTHTFFSCSLTEQHGVPSPLELCLEIAESLLIVVPGAEFQPVQDHDAADGCRLLESLLFYGRGHPALAAALPRLFANVLRKMQYSFAPGSPTNTFLKVLLIEVLLDSIWAFPQLAVSFLEQHLSIDNLLQVWLAAVPGMVRTHDKKISVLAFLSLFGFDFENSSRCPLTSESLEDRSRFYGLQGVGNAPLRTHGRTEPLSIDAVPPVKSGLANLVSIMIQQEYAAEVQRDADDNEEEQPSGGHGSAGPLQLLNFDSSAIASHIGIAGNARISSEIHLSDDEGELDEMKEIEHEANFHQQLAQLAANAAFAGDHFDEDSEADSDEQPHMDADEGIEEWDQEDEATDTPLYDVDDLGCVAIWMQEDAPLLFGDENWLQRLPPDVQEKALVIAQRFAERQQSTQNLE